MAETKHVPFVPADTDMKEFTLRALLIGLVLAVVLGAANAYLGLKAGMTIAATYPAAVIGMALLKVMKGSILEENMARTVGSIGESVAAGAIFTLPAFFVAGIWPDFFTTSNYITSTLILISGGVLGIMFVALLRRVMVEDPELPYPESVAAAEIHKAGRGGGGGSKFLFGAMIAGALVKALGMFKVFAQVFETFIPFTKQTITGMDKVPLASGAQGVSGTGGMVVTSFKISPAYVGVGYIIGPKLASLNFSGGLIAWGLLTPIILYFIAPYLNLQEIVTSIMAADKNMSQSDAIQKAWIDSAYQVWKYIVRPIAIGGMLVGASFTLFRMRKSLTAGIARSVSDVKKAASGQSTDTLRTEKDIPFTWTLLGIFGVAVATFLITFFLFNTTFVVALVAATVMIILAFFFAAVSGYLVGIMGSSNNPISGLTLTALVVTALIMVVLGAEETHGVASVLGVAAIVCVAAAVAGEMLQDLKAGHILGGTPWKMEVGDIIGVVLAGFVMFGVLVFLNNGDIANGVREGYTGGFGSRELPAPQASLMAILSRGIVEQQMAWPLIIVGMLMGAAFIAMQVKSPMLVSVGMYLPLETTFAIFLGGLIKGGVDMVKAKRKVNEAQDARIENTGVLLASGLIAGEALVGLIFAGFAAFEMFPGAVFENPSFIVSLLVMAAIAWGLIKIPVSNAGNPNDPAPPSAAH
ncbi:MAG TPA: oligopeptide transporter, OPT family [Bacteroidota bacterium]|nr:oligopeptide transporter, OPT family [Bacteroidota bacterium]